MQLIRRLLLFGSALLTLVLLVGCGTNSPGGAASPPSQTPAKPTSTAGAGAVTLQVDKSFYRAKETITVTLKNQSSQTIWFPDHLTNCTVILLQRQKAQPQAPDQGQNTQNLCKLMTATRMHALAARQQLVVPLLAPKEGWLTGWFLATLSYRTSPTANTATTIASPAFTIGPLGL